MTWKESVRRELLRFENEHGDSRFTLQEFYHFSEARLASEYPNNNHVRAKIRQVLQQLRDQGGIEFVDDSGTYQVEGGESSGGSTTQEISILEQLESEFTDL